MSSKVQNTRRIVWTAIGLAATSLLSINAHASDAIATAQKAVDYTDLNLAVPADVSVLYKRLQIAAKVVCGSVDGRQLRQVQQQRKCYRDALSTAVATVNHNSVTALYHSDKSIRVVERRAAMPSRS